MSVAAEAKAVYESDYRIKLEADHFGEFAAVEPISHDVFLGATFIDAALAAKMAHPDRTAFVIRIGHEAAVHLGAIKE